MGKTEIAVEGGKTYSSEDNKIRLLITEAGNKELHINGTLFYNDVVTPDRVRRAALDIQNERGLPIGGLEYRGATDATMIEDGLYQLIFNVTVKNHPTEIFDGSIGYNVRG